LIEHFLLKSTHKRHL